MKRIVFYSLIVFQGIILIGLSVQYFLIDHIGKPIKLSVDSSPMQYIDESITEITLDLAIQSATEKQWDIDESLTHNRKVYVLLEKGSDDIYAIKSVSLDPIKPKDDQVQLKASYHYTFSGKYELSYGFEQVYMDNLYELLNDHQHLIATVKITPWGQHKIVEIETP